MQSIITKIEKILKDDINPMEFSIFDYVGFDPFIIMKVMIAISGYHNDSPDVLVSDIKFCIAANLYMGNIQAKANTRRSDAGREKLNYLISKYNISTGSTGTGILPHTITFPRVTASFPILAVNMSWKLCPKTVNLDFVSRLVPSYMRVSAFMSLLSDRMEPDVRMFLLEAANAYSADMSLAYEKGRLKKLKKDPKVDPRQTASDQWSYAEVIANSPVPDEQSRINIILKLNIASDYVNLANVVRHYRSIMNKVDIASVAVPTQEELEKAITDFCTKK